MTEHVGYEKHDPAGRGTPNSRTGTRSKTVITEIGPVEIDVPRDTSSSFEPKIVRKRQRRLSGFVLPVGQRTALRIRKPITRTTKLRSGISRRRSVSSPNELGWNPIRGPVVPIQLTGDRVTSGDHREPA